MLSAVNFNLKMADTPAKIAKLKALPQNRLVAQERNGKTCFIYATAGCQCVYIGNQAAAIVPALAIEPEAPWT